MTWGKNTENTGRSWGGSSYSAGSAWGETTLLGFQAPTISEISPKPSSIDVDKEEFISFSLKDDSQVELSETKIYVRGLIVYDGDIDTWQLGWTTSNYSSNANNGYNFTIIPDAGFIWEEEEVVSVRVETKDDAGLKLERNWVFTAAKPGLGISMYNFISNAVRVYEKRSPGILEKLITDPGGINTIWEENIYDRTSALEDLYDPQTIPNEWLPWLKSQVGFSEDINFQATEVEIKKIIRNAMEYWGHKPSELALTDAIRMVTGHRFRIRNFFDFRIGEGTTIISELLQDTDPYILDFPSVTPAGINGEITEALRTFDLHDLPEQYFPGKIFRNSKQYQYIEIVKLEGYPELEGFYKIRELDEGASSGSFALNEPVFLLTTTTFSWRLWGGNSDYVTEVRLVDGDFAGGNINRDLLSFLIDQVRPVGERVDIVYLNFLDEFTFTGELDQWSLSGLPEPSIIDGEGVALLPLSTSMITNVEGDTAWGNRIVAVKAKGGSSAKFDIRFVYVDNNNYFFLEVDYSNQTISLKTKISGVTSTITTVIETTLVANYEDTFRISVEYYSANFLGLPTNVNIIMRYNGEKLLDENILATFTTGSLSLAETSSTADIYVSFVEVMPIIPTIDRVGPIT